MLSVLSVQTFEKWKPEKLNSAWAFVCGLYIPWDSEVQNRQHPWTGQKVRETGRKTQTKQTKYLKKPSSFLCFANCLLSLSISKLLALNFSVYKQCLISVLLFSDFFLCAVLCTSLFTCCLGFVIFSLHHELPPRTSSPVLQKLTGAQHTCKAGCTA